MLSDIIAQMVEEGRLPKQVIQAFQEMEARIKALETALKQRGKHR